MSRSSSAATSALGMRFSQCKAHRALIVTLPLRRCRRPVTHTGERAAHTVQQPRGAATDPVRISGRAQILGDKFEAALVEAERDKIVVHRTLRSNCGTPDCWLPPGGGDFEAELRLP